MLIRCKVLTSDAYEEFGDGIKLSYKATAEQAKLCMKQALVKLIKLRLQRELSKNIKKNDYLNHSFL